MSGVAPPMKEAPNPGPSTSTGPGACLSEGDLIKERWKVYKSIGKGAFGEIYQCEDLETGAQVALKTEKLDSKKRVLKIEVAVLKKLQACPFVCRYQQFGRHEEFHFVVMELLGENLSVLRKRQPGKRFSIGTTMRLGMQMVRAIEGMHDHGYLHRDIKPSNFAMGRHHENRDWCFLIDFGLARRYVLPSGDIRTARESAGFRGTARYASINSHLSKELSRRDDMWSLLYMMIEFLKGNLPWSNIENKEDVGRRKIELDSLDLVAGLPPEMASFMEHLRTLDYKDKPNYDFIADLCNQMMENAGVPEEEHYDWELKEDSGNSFKVPSGGHSADQRRYNPDDMGGEAKRGPRRSKAEPSSAQSKGKKSSRKSRVDHAADIPMKAMPEVIGDLNDRQPSPRDIASPASDDGGALEGEDPEGGKVPPIASGNTPWEPPERANPGAGGCQCVMM